MSKLMYGYDNLDIARNLTRYHRASFRYFYSVVLFALQLLINLMCLKRILEDKGTANFRWISYFIFYCSSNLVTIFFIQIAKKWPKLVQEISTCGLDVDKRVKFRCSVALVVLVAIALVEYILLTLAKFGTVLACRKEDVYKTYVLESYPFVFESGVPYHFLLGVILQIISFISILNWSYSDLFIICISMYLSSAIEEIQKKMRAAKKDTRNSPFWKSLRETYTRVTRLVRIFDNAINALVFTSIVTIVFSVCYQLFNILAHGFERREYDKSCKFYSSSLLSGYGYIVYHIYSLFAVITRFLCVTLYGAHIHYASLAIAPALYEVPASGYCKEVERFIEQAHSDYVALSGFNFFYITRQLVLTVAGTVIIYELVLIQFHQDKMIDTTETLFRVKYLFINFSYYGDD